MGAREQLRHFFGFENFGPVIFLGRLKICPNEHPYLKFYGVPPWATAVFKGTESM